MICKNCEYLGEDEISDEGFFICEHPLSWEMRLENINNIPDNCPLKILENASSRNMGQL